MYQLLMGVASVRTCGMLAPSERRPHAPILPAAWPTYCTRPHTPAAATRLVRMLPCLGDATGRLHEKAQWIHRAFDVQHQVMGKQFGNRRDRVPSISNKYRTTRSPSYAWKSSWQSWESSWHYACSCGMPPLWPVARAHIHIPVVSLRMLLPAPTYA